MGFVSFFWFILYEKFSVRSRRRRGGTAWDKIESPSSFSFFFFFFLSSLSPLVYASAPWKQQNNAPWSSTTPCSLFSCVSAWDTVVKMNNEQWLLTWKLDCNLQPRDVLFCLHGRAVQCICNNVQCSAGLLFHLEPSHWHHLVWPSNDGDAELDHVEKQLWRCSSVTVTVRLALHLPLHQNDAKSIDRQPW